MGRQELNDEQRRAVEAPLSPVIVIASAGTGKTKVLTERIVYLIEEKNIPSESILAITFTNLAAAEMKVRVQDRLRYKTPSSIGTIHSIFGEILRNGIEEVCDNRNHSYEVLDESEQESILRRAFKDCGEVPPHPQKMGDIRKILSDWKTEQILNKGTFTLREVDMKYERIFKKYEDLLRTTNNLDFDDVLLFSDLLLDKPQVREYWSNKYKAILVDECQDLNEIQWSLIKKLIPKDQSFNFFAVGDPNQCIYLFNGAKENIFEEIKDLFEDVEEINLVVNYRSDRSIVEFSNDLKSHKSLSVSGSSDEGVMEVVSDLGPVLDEISKDQKKGSWAVLFPRYSNADEIIEVFIKENIPFRISEFRLLEDTSVDQIVKLLKVIFFDNSSPLSSLLWKKEFGLDGEVKKALTKLDNAKDTTLMKYLLEGDEWKNVVPFDIEKVEAILNQIKEFRNKPKDNLAKLIQETYPFLFPEMTPKAQKKVDLFIKWIENIQTEFSEKASRNILLNLRSLAEFSKKEINEDQNDWVILSTIHKTKGLEWNNVIVLKYDDLIDKFSSNDSEDKHLAYVAVTRAKKKLFLIEKLN